MSGVAAPIRVDAMRRVLRLRSLTAGPLTMERKSERHDPVMVDEILDLFQLKPGMTVVDGTLGLGGHANRFLELLAPNGTLVGFDWDKGMLEIAKQRLLTLGDTRLFLVNESFGSIERIMHDMHVKADAILLDLGLNSAQVDDPNRGFSFSKDGPLDMRMDRSQGEPASAILNRMSPGEIEVMLQDYGDERWARMIATRIVERRKAQPLRTTTDLVECVLAAIPAGARDKRIHPATRTFQAVRIYVNSELDDLEDSVMGAAASLAENGVLAVLSYHSGEDRIIKRAFRDLASEGYREVYKKPLQPGEAEERRNPRSRSAKLRALVRQSI